ncbi:MAG: poly-gamma-glutamate synthase PgsB [candidate division Zixibacteria bacterium]|nr:poly-gamma-glutamate synthase PgsB [candidate division Zixibacteria bacterium]
MTYLPFVLMLAVLILLAVEKLAIHRGVHRIAMRIQVNGTRGKSSVVRYIAAGMRASGHTTFAKVTGIRPLLISPGGKATIIPRLGGARVQEQFHIIRRAARARAECLTLECMSITPELQRLESRHFQPQIYVLTEIRDDHREKLGDDISEQIEAICSAIPSNATIVTGAGQHLETVKQYAEARHSRVVVIPTPDELDQKILPDGVFAENVALALTACRLAGVDTDNAARGIHEETQRHRTRAIDVVTDGTKVLFINGFAVNDVPSAQSFLDNWRRRYPTLKNVAVIFNTRSDRPLRTKSFAEWFGRLPGLRKLILVGDHAGYARRAILRYGTPEENVVVWSRRRLGQTRELLTAMRLKDTLVVGFGNISGDGFRIVDAMHTWT